MPEYLDQICHFVVKTNFKDFNRRLSSNRQKRSFTIPLE